MIEQLKNVIEMLNEEEKLKTRALKNKELYERNSDRYRFWKSAVNRHNARISAIMSTLDILGVEIVYSYDEDNEILIWRLVI